MKITLETVRGQMGGDVKKDGGMFLSAVMSRVDSRVSGTDGCILFTVVKPHSKEAAPRRFDFK